MTPKQIQNKFIPLPEGRDNVDINSIEVHDDKLLFKIDEDTKHEYDIKGFGDKLCFRISRCQKQDTESIDFFNNVP